MKRRFAGWHPLHIMLVYGEDWSVFKDDPFTEETAWIALRPDEFSPGIFDFRCVSGSAVTVFDQVRGAGERAAPIGTPSEPERAPFFDMLYELAKWSGPLKLVTAAEIYTGPLTKPPFRVAAHLYAFECKLADPERRWPWWWPESLDKSHGEKIAAWCKAARSRAAGTGRSRRAA